MFLNNTELILETKTKKIILTMSFEIMYINKLIANS